MTEQSHILAEHCDGVLSLTLQRPERKNALNLAMYKALEMQLKEAANQSAISAVVLSGSDGVFTSGNDLQDFLQGEGTNFVDSPIAQFLWAYTTFPKPVIVALDGQAVGVGTTLLLHSDFVYASERSELSLPFAGLGLCPEYASSYLLPRLAGYAKASEWLLLGDPISASEAEQFGLVNKVVSDPLVKAKQVAQRLSFMPPNAVRKTKALLKSSVLPRVQKTMVAEADAFINALQGKEFAEAVAAFFEKRTANFNGLEGDS